ncbi:MAG: VENN motif pre-toxin domain-containing protein, partial [Snodgrassella sp.]|nr:VENN motif pre-toxin domain-containing protein [Snodgrassella sp.]
AAGAEATAPIVSKWLYGKNPADLTADEKATVSAIAGLTGAATGVAVGDSMADVAQGNQAGHVAVDNNTEFGDKIRSYIEDAKHYWHTEKEAKDNLDVIRNVAVNLIGDGLDSVVGLSDYGIDSLNAVVYCTGLTPNLCNQMQATLDPKNKAALNSIKAAFDTRTYIQFYELLDKAAHGDLQAREAAGELLAAVLITKKVNLNVGKVSTAGNSVGKGVTGADKSTAQKRPTPKDSEKDVGTSLPPDYKPQVSYKDGKEVPYGTKGSTRPDWCNRTTCSIEVKNYDIGKYADNLINNVSKQAIDRSKHLPNGMQQQIVIDVRGQNVPPSARKKITEGIEKKSQGTIKEKQIRFKDN